jgi:hypothetical protein
MTGDGPGPVAIAFGLTLLGAVAAFRTNIQIAKRKVNKWDSNSTIWFIMAIGVGEPALKFWKDKVGYSEDEARLINKYQWLCVGEIFIGFLLSNLFVIYLVSLR